MSYKKWYGIPGLEFIWNGNWSDPTIKIHACKHQKERKDFIKVGKEFNSFIVEDSLYENYNNSEESREISFENYIKNNVDLVWDYVYLAMGGSW